MSCKNCVSHVKEALSDLKGVTSVDVNLKDKYAVLETANEVEDVDIKSAIDGLGYKVVGIEAL